MSQTPADDTEPAQDAAAADAADLDDHEAAAEPSVEAALRERLGVPEEAARVMIFAQNAHLDIDWQQTFDDYYDDFVEDIFLEAREILDTQTTAHYSVAEMAFLQRHLEQHPEERASLRAHIADNALHIIGGGMTSPDTLLPETELLIRDFLYGTRFAEDELDAAPPRTVWLPDSFGHAGTTPDVVAALGFEAVAFSRIDGGLTIFEALRAPDTPPRPGSTAELLASLGSADFVWLGPGGGRVLAHLMPTAGLYCMGDNIDYFEPMQPPGGHVGQYRGSDPDFTDASIDRYADELIPWALTPYLFVPVGCDFAHPKTELVAYLDGYNERRYPETGVWAVAASFDEYAALVREHGSVLPELAVSLEPYFMGFYGTRPAVKRRTREAARPFFAAELLAAALGPDSRVVEEAQQDLHSALSRLVWSNHHDFITGTATDAVTADEQLPLLTEAEEVGHAALRALAESLAREFPSGGDGVVGRIVVVNASGSTRSEVVEADLPLFPALAEIALIGRADDAEIPLEVAAMDLDDEGYHRARVRLRVPEVPPFGWRMFDLVEGTGSPDPAVQVDVSEDHVVLSNDRVEAELARVAGRFALTSVRIDGEEALRGASFSVADYDDDGGLWRLGHEMDGCDLTPLAPAEGAPESVEVLETSPLRARVAFRRDDLTREVWLDADAPGLGVAVETAAAQGSTRTVSFALDPGSEAVRRTSLAGGYADREVERVYAPTFWPAVEWIQSGRWALLLRQSTGVRFDAQGGVELIAVRDARSERCDILGGTGSDTATHRIEWLLVRAESPAEAAAAGQRFNRPLVGVGVAPPEAGTPSGERSSVGSLLGFEGSGLVTAVKPALRGEGIVVRAVLLPGPLTLYPGEALLGRQAIHCDAAERDLEALGTVTGPISLEAGEAGNIVTIRLR